MRFLPFLLAFMLLTCSFSSYVWWNEDWTSRKKITLTGPSSEVTDVPVLIRLHTGNFDFFSASDNGGDVRLAGANGQR
jgi:biopolymer transport protein ExbB